MDIIQLLPDSVANQIAAGEVIQRPASVIKELVENAVDAGATTIKVLVVDAGRTSVQVIDDGCGMSDTDARLSFDRHATSKIRKADDLFALHTMGFRGEALASIAAVAQVTLQTRLKGAELGTRVRISGSRVTEQEPVVCPVGSNFLVENLFYNVPARRKFLKSNSTEMSNITQSFERIVLVYPEIAFVLYNNGQEVMNLRATTLRQRVVDVFGKRLNQSLLPLEIKTTLCSIKGFVGKPESARKKKTEQFFFVNGRYMKHPYFHKAVMMVFERLVPAGEQVPYFIYLDVDPKEIDVNIHPVKTKIQFENERAIWQILMAAVRDAVGKFSEITSLDFDTEGRPDIPVYNSNSDVDVLPPVVDVDPLYNPFASASDEKTIGSDRRLGTPKYLEGKNYGQRKLVTSSLGISESLGVLGDLKNHYLDVVNSRLTSIQEPENLFPSVLNTEDSGDSSLCGLGTEYLQYKGTYIISQVEAGLIIVDQHRADVRVLFEHYMQDLSARSSHTQKILFPETVQFPPSYAPLLGTIIEEMCRLGFDIKSDDNVNFVISGIPAGLSGLNAVTLVNDLVSAAVECGSNVTEEINFKLALELANRAATPYGEVLSQETMGNLVGKLLQCESSQYTPDGKIIINMVKNDYIENLFKFRG